MNDIELKKLQEHFLIFNSFWDNESFIDGKKYISRSACMYYLIYNFGYSESMARKEIYLKNNKGIIYNLIDNKLIKECMHGWVVL